MNDPLAHVSATTTHDTMDFRELWRTVSRHRWAVLGVTVLMAAVGVLRAVSAEPIYRATITILVENRPTRAVEVQEVYDPGYGGREYLATQFQLLRSREVAARVVDRLSLGDNGTVAPPPPPPSFWSRIRSLDLAGLLPMLSEDPASAPPPETPGAAREQAINGLQGAITVDPVPGTQLMRVHVQSPSPTLAADIANVLGDVYVEAGLESRLEATERATRWLTQRLSDLRQKMEQSERALQEYREKHQLVNVGGSRAVVEEELLDHMRKLRDAQRRKTELRSTYLKIQQAGSDPSQLQEISSLLLDPTVQRASENLSQAQQAVKQLEERYGEKHPQMSAAQAKLQAASRAYYEQLRLAANGVRAEHEIATETEAALLRIVESARDQIRKLDQRDYELNALERDVQTNRELYEMFLKRFKETDTASTFEAMNARIIDRAVVPTVPHKPDKRRMITLWTVGGLALGLLLASLRHILAGSIRSPEHLENGTQLPVLSVLPPVPGLGRKTSAPALCIDNPRAPFSEGMRTVRASLHLNDVDKRMKLVMVTSALPREGKSSIASAFAAVMGQTERVLLLEADLRAPSIKRIFGIRKERPGLMEHLTDQAKLDDVLYRDEKSGIDVLPVGKVPANPAEVIASAAFNKLIDTLAARYDRLVFDTPPCQVASDSILLSHRMNAVLFVIHGGTTPLRTAQAALKQLRSAHAPLLGHVLNQVDARKAYGHEGAYYVYGQYGQA